MLDEHSIDDILNEQQKNAADSSDNKPLENRREGRYASGSRTAGSVAQHERRPRDASAKRSHTQASSERRRPGGAFASGAQSRHQHEPDHAARRTETQRGLQQNRRPANGNYSPARRRKKNTVKRTSLIVACVVLALILVVMVAVVAYVNSLLGRLNRPDDGTTGPTLSSSQIDDILRGTDPTDTIDPFDTTPTIDPTDVTWTTDPADPLTNENIINILFIGQDARPGETTQRSDAMILCTLNKATNTLTMSSFMRDMYVQIPGYGDSRINASYAIGGMKLLDECLKVNFGVEVDGNIEINFVSFMKVIDMMGGIDMELTAEEAAYLNRRGNWQVEEYAGDWELVEGMNHLTGTQALAYSRIRDIGDDFGRTERQRKVLTELLHMTKDLSMLELNKLLYTVVEMVTTDMSNAQITNLVLQVFPMLSDMEIKTQRVPQWGHYQNANINGMMVLLPDLEKIREHLKTSLIG